MRILVLVGAVLTVAGCTAQMPAPAKVSWQYGAGNGDGVAYPGPAPIYKRAFGAGNGDSVTSGQVATTQYGYGADGMSGTMIRTEAPTMTAQPAAIKATGSSS